MTLKTKIIDHYDKLSPYYKDLWGIHIHHGYWKTGKETKEQAQEQLIRELISRAGIGKRMRILDVGCGIGTAIYLNKYLDADVTGATISVKQIEIGNRLAKESNADVRLMLMDAERLEISDTFDVVWCVEAISHFNEKKKFFHSSRCYSTRVAADELVDRIWPNPRCVICRSIRHLPLSLETKSRPLDWYRIISASRNWGSARKLLA